MKIYLLCLLKNLKGFFLPTQCKDDEKVINVEMKS